MPRVNKQAIVEQSKCVACGACAKVCPRNAISIPKRIYAVVSTELCVGCGLCAKECPASVITMNKMEEEAKHEE